MGDVERSTTVETTAEDVRPRSAHTTMYSRHNEFFYRYETLFACVVELFQLVCNVVGYSLALLTVSSHARAVKSTSVDRVCLTDRQVTRQGEAWQ